MDLDTEIAFYVDVCGATQSKLIAGSSSNSECDCIGGIVVVVVVIVLALLHRVVVPHLIMKARADKAVEFVYT